MKKLIQVLFLMAAGTFASLACARDYTFTIMAGTSGAAWNTKDTVVNLKVGDTLTLVNHDSEVHAIHTGGRPFAHFPPVQPDASYTEPVTGTWDPDVDGPLYDHYNPETGFFWVKVTQ